MPKRGDLREDGMVFWRMKRGKESWISQEAFARQSKKTQADLTRYRSDNREELLARRRAQYAAAPRSEEKRERDAKRAMAWFFANRERAYEGKKRWIANNPEKYRLMHLNQANKRRRRTSTKRGGATTAELEVVRKRAKGVCYYCCRKSKLTFDHVVPLSKGGMHEAHNLVMACHACNATKNNKDPEVFAAKLGRLLI